MRSLLVTNDFPPKVGGIQSYLWELWRRLPSHEVGVLTITHEGDREFDARQQFPVERLPDRMLLPTPGTIRRIRQHLATTGAEVVFVDPALPIGAVGPHLGVPYVVVTHGAEITVYARVPLTAAVMRRVFRRASGVVAAGGYPARQAMRSARRDVPGLVIPPGVDATRFHPLEPEERRAVRLRFGLHGEAPLVLGVSRLVPRKGFDVLIDAASGLPGVHVALVGDGRDRARLERRADQRGVADRVHFLGRLPDEDLPGLYASADVFAMLCRDRWFGLEAEGFGIVFLEAAACGVPAVAGRSGGAHEAVLDGLTGYVVEPRDVDSVRRRLDALLSDGDRARAMGLAARERAEREFSYDTLAASLAPVAAGDVSALGSLRAALAH